MKTGNSILFYYNSVWKSRGVFEFYIAMQCADVRLLGINDPSVGLLYLSSSSDFVQKSHK